MRHLSYWFMHVVPIACNKNIGTEIELIRPQLHNQYGRLKSKNQKNSEQPPCHKNIKSAKRKRRRRRWWCYSRDLSQTKQESCARLPACPWRTDMCYAGSGCGVDTARGPPRCPGLSSGRFPCECALTHTKTRTYKNQKHGDVVSPQHGLQRDASKLNWTWINFKVCIARRTWGDVSLTESYQAVVLLVHIHVLDNSVGD